MQQSPTISIEQVSSSPVTISHNSSENSLNKINKLEKWCRIVKRIIQFFRFIKIPILRSRFIDTISRRSTDHFEIEGLNGYATTKIQEDLLFLDDIKRYQEVFNTLSSFGFIWQDKEFRLAKLKANYIYDHYMSTSEAIAKTNIPLDTIPFVYNRINSPRIFSSLIYFNLFNDAEKFITEKLLMIYIREGLNCFLILPEKQSISIMNRFKGNRIDNESVLSFEHLKVIHKTERSISNRSNIKLKDTIKIEPQYDEIIIPNWTYSIGLGLVYNPIVEKRVKITRRSAQKKTKDVDSSVNSMIKLNHTTPNEMKQFDPTFSKSVLPISSKFRPHINRQHIDNNSRHFNSKNKSLFNSNHFPSSHYSRCDTIFKKNIFDKSQIFICKVHSSSWSESNRFLVKNEPPYRMAVKPQPTDFFNRIQRLCNKGCERKIDCS